MTTEARMNEPSRTNKRKLRVLEAVEAWADVLRSDAPFSERVQARKAFMAELDAAMATPVPDEQAIERAERLVRLNCPDWPAENQHLFARAVLAAALEQPE